VEVGLEERGEGIGGGAAARLIAAFAASISYAALRGRAPHVLRPRSLGSLADVELDAIALA
jgi:hypothetical protein